MNHPGFETPPVNPRSLCWWKISLDGEPARFYNQAILAERKMTNGSESL